ncbi:metal-dependent hydrolase family protein [Variovorax boronicumulans]|uniref:metal-dependent hydrolase family protein n=1 Tax=Variovorax boronicumulans TaxID=436515 RepID=UPI001C5634B0
MSRYITHGMLIDGSGAPPQPLQWLRMDEGRIAEVRLVDDAAAPVPLPADADIAFDATGLTVMPGLIDAHCHLSYGEARSIEEQDLYGSAEYRALRAGWHAGKVLRSGVTSVSDPGGSWNVAVAVRDAIRAGIVDGPRMSAAGKYLTTQTGLADYFPSWVGTPPSGVGALTHDVSQMLTEVRRQVKNGVDFVKVAASGESSTLTPGGGSVPAFRSEELKVIVDEAHRHGRRAAAHARSGVAVVDCIDAGMDWIMHGDYMTQAQCDRLAASGIPLCPTLTFMANIADYGHLVGCSAGRIERIRHTFETAIKVLRHAYRNGVTLITGTDSGFSITPFGQWHARELEIFVEHIGMTPLEAITCATRNAGFTVDPGQVGVLAPGMWADILVIDGDPARDIRVLQEQHRVRAIFKAARAVDLHPARDAIERWPWERVMTVSATELHWHSVRGTQ